MSSLPGRAPHSRSWYPSWRVDQTIRHRAIQAQRLLTVVDRKATIGHSLRTLLVPAELRRHLPPADLVHSRHVNCEGADGREHMRLRVFVSTLNGHNRSATTPGAVCACALVRAGRQQSHACTQSGRWLTRGVRRGLEQARGRPRQFVPGEIELQPRRARRSRSAKLEYVNTWIHPRESLLA